MTTKQAMQAEGPTTRAYRRAIAECGYMDHGDYLLKRAIDGGRRNGRRGAWAGLMATDMEACNADRIVALAEKYQKDEIEG